MAGAPVGCHAHGFAWAWHPKRLSPMRYDRALKIEAHFDFVTAEAELFVEEDVLFKAVEDDLVAAGLAGLLEAVLDELAADALAGVFGQDDDVLDVSDVAAAVDELLFQ